MLPSAASREVSARPGGDAWEHFAQGLSDVVYLRHHRAHKSQILEGGPFKRKKKKKKKEKDLD